MNMKKIILLALIISTLGCSDSETDYSNKKEQELLLDGYIQSTSKGSKDHESFTFLFFDASKGQEFKTISKKVSVTTSYEYSKLPNDEVWEQIVVHNTIQLMNGETVKPLMVVNTYKSDKASKEVKLPPARYFVVAYDTHKKAGNKYAAKYYDLESRYNPNAMTVVIPNYIDRVGAIDWINWEDSITDF